MSDPIVHITSGIPDSGTGNITTLGQTVQLQATTTSGQMGPLVQGAVTTAAPTYIAGNTNPLSLDTSGNLRVTFANATLGVTQSTSPWVVSLSSTTITGTVSVTQSGTWNVGQTGTWNVGLNAGSNVVGKFTTDQTTPGTTDLVHAAQQGTWNVGQTGTWTVQPGNTANTTAWLVTGTGGTFPVTQATSSNLKAQVDPLTPASWAIGTSTQNSTTVANGHLVLGQFNTTPTTITSGNMSPLQVDSAANILVTRRLSAANNQLTNSRVVAAASTNATSLKAGPGNIAAIDVFNVAGYMVFLKLYNKASAPTVGTDTPVWTIPISAGGGFSIDASVGEYFSTGIAYAITKLQADTDATAVAAGDVTGRIKWI